MYIEKVPLILYIIYEFKRGLEIPNLTWIIYVDLFWTESKII